jgi:hypothetical protein
MISQVSSLRIQQLCALLTVLAGAPAAAGEPGIPPGQRVLKDGFESGRFAPEGGLYYKDNAEQQAGRVTFQRDHVKTGQGALTLTVSPTCKLAEPPCSERAEVWERPDLLTPYDTPVWYGLAISIDDPVPQHGGRSVIAQWKRQILPSAEIDYSPFLALRLYRGQLGITVETDFIESFVIGGPQRPDGCKPGEARVLSRPQARQTRALVAIETGTTFATYPAYFDSCAPGIVVKAHAGLPSAQSGWIDFVVRSQPGPGGDGHIEIFANGVAIVTVRGHIGHRAPGLGRHQYFKFGPYRDANPLDWSVSFDDFRRGPRCSDVMPARQCPGE